MPAQHHICLFFQILSFAAYLSCCALAIGLTLGIFAFLGDSLITFGKWCNWQNGVRRQTFLKTCDIAVFLWRSASGFGWHGRNFLRGGGNWLFWWNWIVLIKIYPKMTFSRFYRFFWTAPIFWPFFWYIFAFRKSARTIRKISLIPTYSDGFRTFKKSLPVPINTSIKLLPLLVRNCRADN